MRGLRMRLMIRFLVLSIFVAALARGFAAHAQTATTALSHEEEEDLRKTVRELALRVSALEAELHNRRAGTSLESASLKPVALVVPAVDVRSSVESVTSSGVADDVAVVE